MLKLEKTLRREIAISLRQQERVFNQTFLIALGIAIVLHLLPFLLFHIKPFKISNHGTISLPTHVESDLNTAHPFDFDSWVFSQIETKRKFSDLFAPQISFPELPKMSVDLKEKIDKNQLFTDIEITHLDQLLLPITFLTTRDSIQIYISGPLAEKKALEIPYKQLKDLGFETKETCCNSYRVIYDVRVQDESGEIIWFETKERIAEKKYQELADKILEEIRFSPKKNCCITSGQVEIVLSPTISLRT